MIFRLDIWKTILYAHVLYRDGQYNIIIYRFNTARKIVICIGNITF